MEKIIAQNKYSIYQGVNFFWSDGSVLDIWYRQIKRNESVCITNLNQDRFYSRIEDICNDIINNLTTKNKIILPTNIFKINLRNLYEAMITLFDYNNDKLYIMGSRYNEKQIENLHINQKLQEIPEYTKENIISLLKLTLKETEISCL